MTANSYKFARIYHSVMRSNLFYKFYNYLCWAAKIAGYLLVLHTKEMVKLRGVSKVIWLERWGMVGWGWGHSRGMHFYNKFDFDFKVCN